MSIQKTTIHIEARKDRLTKNGLVPIRINYQSHNQRVRIATPLKVLPESWDTATQLVVYIKSKDLTLLNNQRLTKNEPPLKPEQLPSEKEVKHINTQLLKIVDEIVEIERDFKRERQDFLLQDVVERFYEIRNAEAGYVRKQNPHIYIGDWIYNYIRKNETLIKDKTLAGYRTVARHLEAFALKKKDRITFENLDYDKLKEFQKYFIEKGLNNTSIQKQFTKLKTLIKRAVKLDKNLKYSHDFRDFFVSTNDSDNEVIALEEHEFDALLDLDLSDYSKKAIYQKTVKSKLVDFFIGYQSLEKCKDVFVFACATGLRYSDVADLKPEHIRNNTITKKAVKTGSQIHIPTNHLSNAILKKYNNKLPVFSNQKCNEYLKVIGCLAGINTTIERTREYGTEKRSTIYKKWELLSTHVARKTFITMTLTLGGMPETVMQLSGHKQYKSFKRYVHIADRLKSETMALWDKRGENNANNLRLLK